MRACRAASASASRISELPVHDHRDRSGHREKVVSHRRGLSGRAHTHVPAPRSTSSGWDSMPCASAPARSGCRSTSRCGHHVAIDDSVAGALSWSAAWAKAPATVESTIAKVTMAGGDDRGRNPLVARVRTATSHFAQSTRDCWHQRSQTFTHGVNVGTLQTRLWRGATGQRVQLSSGGFEPQTATGSSSSPPQNALRIAQQNPFAPVAQLDRALASGAKGCRFESCRARQTSSWRSVSVSAGAIAVHRDRVLSRGQGLTSCARGQASQGPS
jgi:hypothetical protein